jgi:hypothetical protein
MITLENDELILSVIDPAEDLSLAGSRYCTGGYVFQIEHREFGPIFSGPEHPGIPSGYNGQGIPETFCLQPIKLSAHEDRFLNLGVGITDAQFRKTFTPARWFEERKSSCLLHSTVHCLEEESLEIHLRRKIAFSKNLVSSKTEIRNEGRNAIPITWFPHPFFYHPANTSDAWVECAGLRSRTTREPMALVQRDLRAKEYPFERPFVQTFSFASDKERFSAFIRSRPFNLTMRTDYIPSVVVFYSNDQCFSLEPYFERQCQPGEVLELEVSYLIHSNVNN